MYLTFNHWHSDHPGVTTQPHHHLYPQTNNSPANSPNLRRRNIHQNRTLYDTLRASPQWNKTLFILTFDETGGFHDHDPPRLAPRPDKPTDTETAANGEKYTFGFDRLGGRILTLLSSPWAGKEVMLLRRWG